MSDKILEPELFDDMEAKDTRAYLELGMKMVTKALGTPLETNDQLVALLTLAQDFKGLADDIEFTLSGNCPKATAGWCYDPHRKPSARRSSRKVARFEYEALHEVTK